MRVVAFITEPPVIDRILTHLAPPGATRPSPARTPAAPGGLPAPPPPRKPRVPPPLDPGVGVFGLHAGGLGAPFGWVPPARAAGYPVVRPPQPAPGCGASHPPPRLLGGVTDGA
jgi:hypothetical protein